MKHVHTCLSAREDRESSFQHCGCSVRPVQACLCAERLANAISTSEVVLLSSWRPVQVLEKIEKAVFTGVEAL